MSTCGHRAVLVITHTVADTSTNLAKDRIELVCRQPEHHQGPHVDAEQGESWGGEPGRITMLLRDESELT